MKRNAQIQSSFDMDAGVATAATLLVALGGVMSLAVLLVLSGQLLFS